MHAWWSELRSRALLPAIEAAPRTVEALHAVLGGSHLVPGTWGDFSHDFSAVSDPVGHRGKISPSSGDQMKTLLRPRAALPRYLVRVPIAAAARATGVLTTMHAFSISDDLIP